MTTVSVTSLKPRPEDVDALMREIGRRARAAARRMALVPGPVKDAALREAAAWRPTPPTSTRAGPRA